MNITITYIEQLDDDHIVVYFDALGLITNRQHIVPIAAIDTRKAVYDLDTDRAAFESLMREVGYQTSKYIYDLDIQQIRSADPLCEYLQWRENVERKELEAQGETNLDHLGGLHEEVEISYQDEAMTQLQLFLGAIEYRPELPAERQEALRERALRPHVNVPAVSGVTLAGLRNPDE